MVSPSLLVLSIQISMSFIIFALLAKWYILPHLNDMKKEERLSSLLWVQVFRYLPLVLLAKEQNLEPLPTQAITIIALGDLLSSILAIVAIIMLKKQSPLGLSIVWLFSIVSTLDIITALSTALIEKLYLYQLGVNWFVLTIYVPVVIISQVLILRYLRTKDDLI